jgi:GNAT superfamily N-acetyltransferase
VDFTLQPEQVEQIIFAMEDQQHSYYVHRRSGELLRADEVEEGGELVPIPEWQPVNGFLMMEKFVARLRNPLLRLELKDALASGRGVFRKFKDILKDNVEVERLWFAFKERELRAVVWQWYNEHRELAGLERLVQEPEEPEGLQDLLGSDFAIVPLHGGHEEVLHELDESAFAARFAGADPARVATMFKEARKGLPDAGSPDSLAFVAETPEGEFAGFVWAVEEGDPLAAGRVLRVHQLAVAERYRGLGLGAMLLRRLIVQARDRGLHLVRIELNGKCLDLAGFFQGLGFKPISQDMELDPTRWEQ